MNNNIAIKVENLSKCYTLRVPNKDADGNSTTEHWALKDVSFEIKKGESVGIIGPNGSGKSTLLKILAGITKPTSGKVTINGRVASILDVGAGFHPELSGRENVFLNGQIHGFSKKEIAAKFDEIVEFSGVEKFIDEPVKNYSDGMFLRLAFSIIIHLDFDVYLFDEVLSVGDAEFQGKCLKKIANLIDKNKTNILVYHNTNFGELMVSRKIDIRKVNNNSFLFNENNNKEFDKEIILESGILESIILPKQIMMNLEAKKLLVALKTNTYIASSQIYNINHQNKYDSCKLMLNLKLSMGIYNLNFYDITINEYELLYSILIKVPTNNGYFKNLNDQFNSVLLLKTKLINV